MKTVQVILCLFVASLYANGTSVSDSKLEDDLYNSILVADYDNAVEKSKQIYEDKKSEVITNVVNKLIRNNKMNCMEYAYQLWMQGSKDIVRECFPVEFTLIFAENNIKLMYKRDGLALTLRDDSNNDGRLAYGDGKDKTSPKVSWKFVPLWENNKVYFKIVNTQRNQYLTLSVKTTPTQNHMAYGVNSVEGFKAQWTLQPTKYDNDVLFFMYNREYNEALVLSKPTDTWGNRMAFGYSGRVVGSPEQYAWGIKAF
ncbi:low molecular mass 30 kDa lipoprotein 19G1-like [Bombyx mandarina]|uniref:Low molecular mass 30 kDa lipoprotein 19G1-like n=1 Tax=Bombyx mandarina TaxID=7092 RepID=A0A6J2JKF9_BOMMA|nr:low molecular mass 30 kDa lipoprotein 19G1-like [Bombyx mandarina]